MVQLFNEIKNGNAEDNVDAFCAAERTPVRLPADTRRRQRTAL